MFNAHLIHLTTPRSSGEALMRSGLVLAVAAAISVGAQAQTSSGGSGASSLAGTSASGSTAETTSYRAVRANRVIGMNVRNEKGENLGEIEDLIVNMNTGDVRYAILSFDPGIFREDKLFAVPPTELQIAQDRNHVVYRMNKAQLEQAAINRPDWNMNYVYDRSRIAGLDGVWGVQQPTQGAVAHRASDLLGKDIRSRTGEEIGEVEELVINMANGKVHYAVMDFDVGWTTPDKRVIVPLQSFTGAGRDELVLDVDRQKVQALKDFTQDRYGNLSDRNWLVDVDRYLITLLPAGSNPSGDSPRR